MSGTKRKPSKKTTISRPAKQDEISPKQEQPSGRLLDEEHGEDECYAVNSSFLLVLAVKFSVEHNAPPELVFRLGWELRYFGYDDTQMWALFERGVDVAREEVIRLQISDMVNYFESKKQSNVVMASAVGDFTPRSK